MPEFTYFNVKDAPTAAEDFAAIVSAELRARGLPDAVCVGEQDAEPGRARFRAVSLLVPEPPWLAWSIGGGCVLMPPRR